MRRGYVESDWGQIHYRHAGGGEPSLVIFHESPLSSAVFEPTIKILADEMSVWAFDTPGYGLSDPPPSPPSIEDYARVLLQAIDRVGIADFAILGSHTGVSIAVEVVAAARHGRIHHAILTGVPLLDPEDRARYLAHHSPELSLQADGSHLIWAWKRYLGRSQPGDTQPHAPLHLDFVNLLASHIITNPHRYQWGYEAAFRHDVGPGLAALTCPTLILNAEFDSLAFADGEAAAVVEGADLVRLAGVAGRPYWLIPDIYAAEVSSFIATRSAGAKSRASKHLDIEPEADS